MSYRFTASKAGEKMKVKHMSLYQFNRVFVTSDIHGAYELLNQLLDRIDLSSKDVLFILGDSCDRGRNTRKVYNTIRDLQQDYNVIHLMGNHEKMMIDALVHQDNYMLWIFNGGQMTLKSYPEGKVFDHHLDYLQTLPYAIETSEYILVHAGIDPLKASIEEQSPQTVLWTRMLMQPMKLATDKTVIFGHNITPTGRITKVSSQQIAIDCGSYVYNRLGCLELKSMKEIYVEK